MNLFEKQLINNKRKLEIAMKNRQSLSDVMGKKHVNNYIRLLKADIAKAERWLK